MVQNFYTLEEAAKVLGTSVDALNQMVRNREVRAFSDRGSWKFRQQDVDEMARLRQAGSIPDFDINETAQTDSVNIFDEDALLDGASLSAVGLNQDELPTTVGNREQLKDEGNVRLIIAQDVGNASGSDVKLVPGSGSGKTVESPAGQPPADSDIKMALDDAGLATDASGVPDFAIPRTEDLKLGERLPPKITPAIPAPGLVGPTGESSEDIEFNFKDDLHDFKMEGNDENDFNLADLDSNEELDPVASDKAGPVGNKGNDQTLAFENVSDFDDIRLSDDTDSIMDGPASGINLHNPNDSGLALDSPSPRERPSDIAPLVPDSSGSGSEFDLDLGDSESDSIHDFDELPAFKDDEEELKPSTPTARTPAPAKTPLPAQKPVPTGESDSDFELAIDDEFEIEEESGSEVVAYEEDSDGGAIDEDEFDEEMSPVAAAAGVNRVGVPVAMAEAPWPVWMAPILAITSLILVLVGIMMFEVMRNAWSYHEPYQITGTVVKQVAGIAESIGLKSK